MRGIFIASGPAFKSGVIVDWIKLVDEYQIFLEVNYLLHPKMFWAKNYVGDALCIKVLGIEGEEHQGTFSRIEGMLAESEPEDGDEISATPFPKNSLFTTIILTVCTVTTGLLRKI